jgi:hypothetical protein
MSFRALAVCVASAAVVTSCSGHGVTGVDASLVSFSGGSVHPAAGTIVVSATGHEVAEGRSNGGSIRFDLDAGNYTLDGTTSKGVKCVQRSISITGHKRDILTLECG